MNLVMKKKLSKKSIDYAFSDDKGKGGFMVTASEDGVLVGVVVMNHTGMSDFIPEYYLVYVAVHKNVRGKGIGGKIIKQAIEHAETDVALHVEYDNPAKKLYERLGFESKYAEMRYSK